MIVKNLKDLRAEIVTKKKYHTGVFSRYGNDLITKGTATVRLNAAMARERVRTYDEILDLIDF